MFNKNKKQINDILQQVQGEEGVALALYGWEQKSCIIRAVWSLDVCVFFHYLWTGLMFDGFWKISIFVLHVLNEMDTDNCIHLIYQATKSYLEDPHHHGILTFWTITHMNLNYPTYQNHSNVSIKHILPYMKADFFKCIYHTPPSPVVFCLPIFSSSTRVSSSCRAFNSCWKKKPEGFGMPWWETWKPKTVEVNREKKIMCTWALDVCENGNLSPRLGVKQKNIWNHHIVTV